MSLKKNWNLCLNLNKKVRIVAYWSFFRIKSLKTPIIAYICGIYKFKYAKNAFYEVGVTFFQR